MTFLDRFIEGLSDWQVTLVTILVGAAVILLVVGLAICA